MKTESDRLSMADEGSIAGDFLRGILLFIWGLVRISLLVVLCFLEPFVRFVLVGTAFVTVITAFVFEGASAPPVIPFWVMMCIALGCLLVVPLYHGVIRFLSR